MLFGGIVTSIIMSCCVSCIIYKDPYAVGRICGHCILKFVLHFALSSVLPDLKEYFSATPESGYCSTKFLLILEAIHFCFPLITTCFVKICFMNNKAS